MAIPPVVVKNFCGDFMVISPTDTFDISAAKRSERDPANAWGVTCRVSHHPARMAFTPFGLSEQDARRVVAYLYARIERGCMNEHVYIELCARNALEFLGLSVATDKEA